MFLFCLICSIGITLFGQTLFSQRLFTYDFLWHNFVKVKSMVERLLNIMACQWFVKNYKKSLMNIMLIISNDERLDFKFFNFTCIMVSKVQPTIDISWIINNDESNFKSYVYDQIGFAYNGVFINQQSQ